MVLWRRRRDLEARLGRLEQRVADLEDVADPTLGDDLLDDLAQRLAELILTAPSRDELVELRLRTARLANEVAGLAAEVRPRRHEQDSLVEPELRR